MMFTGVPSHGYGTSHQDLTISWATLDNSISYVTLQYHTFIWGYSDLKKSTSRISQKNTGIAKNLLTIWKKEKRRKNKLLKFY